MKAAGWVLLIQSKRPRWAGECWSVLKYACKTMIKGMWHAQESSTVHLPWISEQLNVLAKVVYTQLQRLQQKRQDKYSSVAWQLCHSAMFDAAGKPIKHFVSC